MSLQGLKLTRTLLGMREAWPSRQGWLPCDINATMGSRSRQEPPCARGSQVCRWPWTPGRRWKQQQRDRLYRGERANEGARSLIFKEATSDSRKPGPKGIFTLAVLWAWSKDFGQPRVRSENHSMGHRGQGRACYLHCLLPPKQAMDRGNQL